MHNTPLKASLFIVGTEITRGIIQDRHVATITKELTRFGFHVNRVLIVPDDEGLDREFLCALTDSSLVIVTGGLGPTSDDMTRSIIASAAGVELEIHPEAYQTLYDRIGERINGANLRQVQIPRGFTVIRNDNGTAPGFYGDVEREGRKVKVFALPGPPRELHPMLHADVLPILATMSGTGSVQRDEYSVYLTPESKLEEIVASHAYKGLTWGTRVQEYRISLYLSGGSQSQRDLLAQNVAESLGPHLIEKGDVEIIDRFVELLNSDHLMVSAAESCTGGLIGKILTDRSGSSSYFDSSYVTYSNRAKVSMLNVKSSTLDRFGAVSRETVLEMAQGALEQSSGDIALAVSGIAGPEGGTPDKPVGTVWFAFASAKRPPVAVRLTFTTYGRSSVRRRGALAAIYLAYLYLSGKELLDIVDKWQYI